MEKAYICTYATDGTGDPFVVPPLLRAVLSQLARNHGGYEDGVSQDCHGNGTVYWVDDRGDLLIINIVKGWFYCDG